MLTKILGKVAFDLAVNPVAKAVANSQRDQENQKLLQLAQQVNDDYENSVRQLAITTISNSSNNELKNYSDAVTQQAISELKIDTKELLIEGMNVINENPNSSEEELAIKLLKKIADNKKFKKMSKIAEEMINERWWDKHGKNK